MISLKNALFWTLFGFVPRCGCGKQAVCKQVIEAGANKVGIIFTCDEHIAEGNVGYVDRVGYFDA